MFKKNVTPVLHLVTPKLHLWCNRLNPSLLMRKILTKEGVLHLTTVYKSYRETIYISISFLSLKKIYEFSYGLFYPQNRCNSVTFYKKYWNSVSKLLFIKALCFAKIVTPRTQKGVTRCNKRCNIRGNLWIIRNLTH